MVNEIKRQSTKLLPKNSNTEQTELLYTFNHIESLAFKRCNYLIVLSCKVIDIIYICECVFITFKTFVGYDGNSLFDSKSCSILNVLVWIFPPKSAPLIRLGQKLEAPQFKHHCFKLFIKKMWIKKVAWVLNPKFRFTERYRLHQIKSISCHLGGYLLETVQDFLIKLDIKPLMHLLEISIFSLNNDLARLTKIMNNLVKDLKILSFKVIFLCLKLVESFQKKSVKNIWLGDQLILMKFFENFDFY